MCVNKKHVNGTAKMQREEVAEVEGFKYHGLNCAKYKGREAEKRIQAGWNGCRRMSGLICDRRVLCS